MALALFIFTGLILQASPCAGKLMSDSTLKVRLTDEMKTAMRAKDSVRLGTLRFLLAAIKQKEVDERRELTDQDITAIIERQVKQRRESIAAFEQAGRADALEQERAELSVLQEFLPAAADEAEIEAVVDEALAALAAEGATGPSAMGKAMALIKPRLAGRADMSQVSRVVSARLKGS